MKTRGTHTITKDLILPNPGGSTPIAGRIAFTDDNGSTAWEDLHITQVENRLYPYKHTLVSNYDVVYISVVDNASGALPLDNNQWKELGTGGGSAIPVTSRPIGPWPTGTPLENIIEACCYPDNISNFRLNGYGDTVNVPTNVSDPTFYWNVSGSPTNVRLSDNKGLISNVDVTGMSSYTATGVSYNPSAADTVTWTLSYDQGSSLVDTLIWVVPVTFEKTYFSLSGVDNYVPTAAEIQAGSFVAVDSSTSVTVFDGVTIDGSNYWVATPEPQSVTFTKMTPVKSGSFTEDIGAPGSSQTLVNQGIVVVGGINYRVYSTQYATAVNGTEGLTLHT